MLLCWFMPIRTTKIRTCFYPVPALITFFSVLSADFFFNLVSSFSFSRSRQYLANWSPANPYLKSLTLPEGMLCYLHKNKLSSKISLDHQEHFQPAMLKCTNYVTTCCIKEKNLWGFRQPLNSPLKSFIWNDLHTFAYVRYHNLQKTLSKFKTLIDKLPIQVLTYLTYSKTSVVRQ